MQVGATSKRRVPALMMLDLGSNLAQVQSVFELNEILPAATFATLTLSGFTIRNEIRADMKEVKVDIKEINAQVDEHHSRSQCTLCCDLRVGVQCL